MDEGNDETSTEQIQTQTIIVANIKSRERIDLQYVY